MTTKLLAGLALAVGMSLGATSAMAAACSTYVNGATNPNPSTDDVAIVNSLGVTTQATDCYGHADFSPNNLTAVTSFANTNGLFDTANQGSWTGVLRLDAGASPASQSFGGLNFTLSGATDSVSGTFTLAVSDNDPTTAPSLPAKLDLVFTLKSSTETDFYFFDGLSLDSSNPGTYTVNITNKKNIAQNLSDISLLARGPITPGAGCTPTTPGCTPNSVPEPGSLALVGLAIAAAGFARRRKA